MESTSLDSASPPNHDSSDSDGVKLNNHNANERNGDITPPYWIGHQRSGSNASLDSSGPSKITLEDHTEESSVQSGALWAKSVTIDDYTIVSGNPAGIGAYVVWNCQVEMLDVGQDTINDFMLDSNIIAFLPDW
ncbi:MAG: PX domain-containing protein ypt35 [Cirrosporium novae-zelandiae]|nr:MAG: PX domain-containing protein ypt35 [Cirrosporium novae-zelandiae]